MKKTPCPQAAKKQGIDGKTSLKKKGHPAKSGKVRMIRTNEFLLILTNVSCAVEEWLLLRRRKITVTERTATRL